MRHELRRLGGTLASCALLGGAAAAAACDDPTAPAGDGTLDVALTTPVADADEDGAAPPGVLRLRGVNGLLEITDLRFVLGDLQLRPEDEEDDCADEPAACREVAPGPLAVDLPLGGGTAELTTAPVPADAYGLLRVRFEDLEAEDGDGITKAQAIGRLLQELRLVYPDLPRTASMVVAGTFTAPGGEARDFITYFRGEPTVELGLGAGLAIQDGDERRLIVHIDPALWFRDDGAVLDLSLADGQITAYPFEIPAAITGVALPAGTDGAEP